MQTEPEGRVAAPVDSERFARQSRFWGIGPEGQRRIGSAHVAVIGCGGLGSAAAELLARGGVGRITLVDRDIVEVVNLHRQILYDEADAACGAAKADAAARAIQRINSAVRVDPVVADVTAGNVERIIGEAQVVLDGTDNFETRYIVNDACVKLGKPWVYGGAIASTGMVMTILPGESACLRCAFPVAPAPGSVLTCDTVGVLASTVVAVVAMQCAEVLKLLVGDRESLRLGLTAFDVWTNDHVVSEAMPRVPGCPCCALRRFDYLDAAVSQTRPLRGRDAVQVTPDVAVELDLEALAERLRLAGVVQADRYLLRCRLAEHELTVFADGRAIVTGTTDPAVARSIYSRYVGL